MSGGGPRSDFVIVIVRRPREPSLPSVSPHSCRGPLGTCSVLVTAARYDGCRALAEALTGGRYQTPLQGMHPVVGWIHTLADSLERRFGSGQRDVWAPLGFWGRGRLRAWCMGRQQHPQVSSSIPRSPPPRLLLLFVLIFVLTDLSSGLSALVRSIPTPTDDTRPTRQMLIYGTDPDMTTDDRQMTTNG